ncbi:hypothetical protein F5884DRAFT_778451 [Xylogone sp. PMI_703]|nr:hypothetical protein F5884DRAFT_778451 [Xylogone sp. PMI_703]
MATPVLVTGAAGRVGGIGRRIIAILQASNVPVRALVRQDDERAESLRNSGVEVVVADLTKSEEVFSALQGCGSVFFSMSVSAQYLEATAVMAAATRATPSIKLVINMSQMTVSGMDLTHVTASPQHRLHWLCEQVLNWSGVPVVHLRPTVFQQHPFFWGFAARSIEASQTIQLPFGRGRTSPIAAQDIAEVATKVLLNPPGYIGRVLELTGPRSVDMDSLAEEYSAAVGYPVRYVEPPVATWRQEVLEKSGLPEHVIHHFITMAELHAAGYYDRCTNTVEEILGRPATSLSDTIRDGNNNFPISRTAHQA